MRKVVFVVMTLSILFLGSCSKENDEVNKPPKPQEEFAQLFVTLKGRLQYSDIFVVLQKDNFYSEKMNSSGVLDFDVSEFIGESLSIKVGVKKGTRIQYFEGLSKIITIKKGKNILGFNLPHQEKTSVPKANFTYTQDSEHVPSVVSFNNLSENAVAYKWSIGGRTYTSKTPQNIEYTIAGKYAVTLTAIGSNGKTDIHTEYITVKEELTPKASFTYTQNSDYAPVVIRFSNNSTNATSYKWYFGDNTISTSQNPSKKYTKSGEYTVRLVVRNYKKTHTYVQKITVVRPTRVRIKKIVLVDYPRTRDTGGGWDRWGNGRADVFWKITDEQGNFYKQGVQKDDIQESDLPYTYTERLPYTFTIDNPNRKYNIEFYDYDSTSADEYMGGGYFIPADRYDYDVLSWKLENGLKFNVYIEWIK